MVTIPQGRPTVCFVDLNALGWNFRQIRSKVDPSQSSSLVRQAVTATVPAFARAPALKGSDAFVVATLGRVLNFGKRDFAIQFWRAHIRTSR
jgi:hypothetical protein